LLVVVDMLGAIITVQLPKGFGGWEHEFAILTMALTLALAGAGAYSVGARRIE
jgi:uncharacterized membrane protein YphA (DoxX/SURF4 family)